MKYEKLYPSQIFFTLCFNCSPWKKMMKTHLFTRSSDEGSYNLVSISACLKNTFPRQARHNNRSKLTILSLGITPATNLKTEIEKQN